MFREFFNGQRPILIPPFPHVLIRPYHPSDVTGNVNFLSLFFVKRNRMKGQRLQLGLNVDFWPASNTYVQTRKALFNEVLEKIKDGLSWGRHPSVVGTLIECIHDNEDWVWSDDREHLLEAVNQNAIAGLIHSLPVFRIKMVDDVVTRL